MKKHLATLVTATVFTLAGTSTSSYGGGYCDGHRDGHKAGSDTFGMGYPGYPGCSGDPGSSGGNASSYQRGFAAGMRDITKEMCRRNRNHQNCR